MEALLYDVYIADAEIYTYKSPLPPDSLMRQELLQSVLTKHQTTHAIFDSSLVWYSGNLTKYIKMNDRISKRYAQLIDELKKKQIEESDISDNFTHFPLKEKNFTITAKDLPQNVYTFKADTTIKQFGGIYDLQLDALGITADMQPVVTFCVKCADTTIVSRKNIDNNGSFDISISLQAKQQANEFYGSIYFLETNNRMNVHIHNLTILQQSYPNVDRIKPLEQKN
ncbi:hypothetical protein FACS1894160_4810 [Bacteroidia bacterium]|nr:hypothetical protein FACS1894160_4810 [Bacteroidia bacterium]